MKLKIGIGFSQNENITQAILEIANQIKTQLNSEQIDLALILTTPHYDPQKTLSAFENIFPHTRVSGGSTPGIIINGKLKRYGIAAFAFRSNTLKIQTIHSFHLKLKNLTEAGESFVKDTGPLFGKTDRKFLLFFFDGLLENMSDFVAGIQKELGDFFPTVGAGTGDQFLFSKTVQYHEKSPASHSAGGIIFGGDVSVYMSRRHGWKPLGKPRPVKKSKNNIIEKIGDDSAIQLYEKFFQDNLGSLKNDVYGKLNARYPLGIHTTRNQEYLIRNVTSILEDGSIICQDHVKKGAGIHIMIGNKYSCLQSAAAAAHDLKETIGDQNIQCLLVFESAARWQILKHSWQQEMNIITDILGAHFPVLGMLTYGEFFNPGTLDPATRNSLLNGNIILVAVV